MKALWPVVLLVILGLIISQLPDELILDLTFLVGAVYIAFGIFAVVDDIISAYKERKK